MRRLGEWTTRLGVFLLALGILEHLDWAKNIGFGLVVGSLIVDVANKTVRWTHSRKSGVDD
jgi:hypothetical protein